MIVTEGFEPVEFDGPRPIDLAFIEHVDGLDGNSILALSKSGSYRGYWRFAFTDAFYYLLIPRAAITGEYQNHFIYCAGRTPYVDRVIKVAEPLEDYRADKLKHYRLVTDRFFFDFIEHDLSLLVLTQLPLPDPDEREEDDV